MITQYRHKGLKVLWWQDEGRDTTGIQIASIEWQIELNGNLKVQAYFAFLIPPPSLFSKANNVVQ